MTGDVQCLLGRKCEHNTRPADSVVVVVVVVVFTLIRYFYPTPSGAPGVCPDSPSKRECKLCGQTQKKQKKRRINQKVGKPGESNAEVPDTRA